MDFIAKVLVPGVLSLLVFLVVTAQQVALICGLRVFQREDVIMEAKYLVALVIILVPYLVGFLEIFWNTTFPSKSTLKHWPGLQRVALGVLMSVIDGACVLIFTLEVATSLPVFILLPLRYAVFAFPVILEQYLGNKKPLSESFSRWSGEWTSGPAACHSSRCRIVLGLLAFITPISLSLILYLGTKCITLRESVSLSLCILGLSLAWSPKLQVAVMSSISLEQTSGRIKIVYQAVKIASILATSVVYAIFIGKRKILLDAFKVGFETVLEFDIIFPVAVNIASGLISHALSYAAIAMCLSGVALCIPVALSTPAAIVMCITYFCSDVYHVNEIWTFEPALSLYAASIIVYLLWTVLFLVKYSDFGRSPRFLKVPYDVVFLNYGWNSIFLEQALFLGYRADGFGRIPESRCMATTSGSKVFVCTTMYRETDYEMEIGLSSFQRLSDSDKFNNVYLEAHIFMDDGCIGTQVQTFGKQLLSLIKNTVVLCDPIRLMTPYGIQVQVKLRGGLALFVHLKDSTKVKASKRWSQAMYFHYILYFKAKIFNSSLNGASQREVNKARPAEENPQSFGNVNGGFTNDEEHFSSKEKRNSESVDDEYATRATLPNAYGHPVQNRSGVESQNDGFICDIDRWLDDQTYILATDADTKFQPNSVLELLNWCKWDTRIGAACGRIHPVGKTDSVIVWHQIFEYSSDFWNIKTTQNSIGNVTCAPGCFSIYRATAIRQILQQYSTPLLSPYMFFVKSTGEDRWMTTLLMLQGWRIRFSPFSNNSSFCPDSISEFLKQRRRWILSDFANTIILFCNLRRLMRNNESFSLLFVCYVLALALSNILGIGTTLFIIATSLNNAFGVQSIYTVPCLVLAILVYAVSCIRLDTEIQTYITVLYATVLSSAFFAAVVWNLISTFRSVTVENGAGSSLFNNYMYFVGFFLMSVIIPGLLHLPEANRICYVVAYLFTIPLSLCLIQIYAVCNLVDQSWGTRGEKSDKKPTFCTLKRKKKIVKSQAGSDDEDQTTSAELPSLADGTSQEKNEHDFWVYLRESLLSPESNRGLDKEELASKLTPLRNRCIIGLLLLNFLWLAWLTIVDLPMTLDIRGMDSFWVVLVSAVFLFLFIQFVGLITCRTNLLFRKLVHNLYGDDIPMWVTERRNTDN